ncbi:MAG: pantoate--beta-alanine ligase [Fimbriimonadaceae bacterium]
MIVLRTIAEVKEFRKGVGSVGFVPTMGALHAGHLILMSEAVASCDVAIGSIFVNPLQFGPNEDLSKYPRQEETDIAMAAGAGVAAMFCPLAEEMVGSNLTTVSVRGVSDLFEGEKRPGHFDGVATIVARLFGIVEPDVAFFGLKDLQQCAVIAQMVRDLCLPVSLSFLETVREPSGLALSSRNAYFSDSERVEAAKLNSLLRKTSQRILESGEDIGEVLNKSTSEMKSFGFEVEYLELVDPHSMKPVRNIEKGFRIIIAARFCGVRLIDNILLDA